MRLSYEPTTGELAIYVKKTEFDLAANDDEYRVFKRTFNRVNLEEFIKGYSGFIKDIFQYITPDEQIRDVVAISTYKKGYTWNSLVNMNSDESSSFLENMMIYGLSVVDKECRQKIGGKNIMDSITKRDGAKLSLIMTLIDTLNLPEPYKKSKKTKNNSRALQKRLNTMDAKLKAYEEKYGFDSKMMWKYYNDDKIELLDDDMVFWLDLYEEKNYILSIDKKRKLVEELADKWVEDN